MSVGPALRSRPRRGPPAAGTPTGKLNTVFKTAPLTAGELALVLILSSVVFFAVELEKLARRKRKIA